MAKQYQTQLRTITKDLRTANAELRIGDTKAGSAKRVFY